MKREWSIRVFVSTDRQDQSISERSTMKKKTDNKLTGLVLLQ